MKTLSLISFVGVDSKTNLDDILEIDKSIPYEFGVLFSDSKSLGNYARYPSYKFCKDFLEWGANNHVNTSLHLCGSVIERYLKQDADVIELCHHAGRIQLNLNIKDYSDYDELSDRLLSVIKAQFHTIILQQNKTKEKFMDIFLDKTALPIDVLNDSSGGFGREISQVTPPDKNHFTGYAGGINPENVASIVKLIEDNNPDNIEYYIDMESGVRENNIFSLEKCRQVIANLK